MAPEIYLRQLTIENMHLVHRKQINKHQMQYHSYNSQLYRIPPFSQNLGKTKQT